MVGIPAANLRSLGGLSVAGGRIAEGRLWRSDNITVSPDDQLRDLHGQGLRTVIDLRAPDEVQLTGTAVLERNGIRHVHQPMTRKSADPATLAATFDFITDYAGVGAWYLRLARARSAILLNSIREIAASDGGVLFYCTAGKDRTGVLAAVILLLLGANDDVVIEDYTRTGDFVDGVHRRHAEATGRPMPSTEYPDHPILHAHRDSMVAFLRGVHAAGGVVPFLSSAAGTGDENGTRSQVESLAGHLYDRLVARD